MTGRDRGIAALLSVALAALAVATVWPARPDATGRGPGQPDTTGPIPTTTPTPAIYREGTIGSPSSINPLTARTQADRDLAALVFSGLVALGPDGGYRPDLASGWTVATGGTRWTFTLRSDARWQDGVPVTADDVVFTVGILKDPTYSGPLGESWRGIIATAIDAQTVRFDLKTPIGGFLQAATVGLLPAHLLRGVRVSTLADSAFSQRPVGSGPFELVSWTIERATLTRTAVDGAVVPLSTAEPGPTGSSPSSPPPSAALPSGRVAPTVAPSPPSTGSPDAALGRPLSAISFSFFADATALAAAYRAGTIDAASGLSPQVARDLGLTAGSHLLTYPGSTLSAIVLNLRPGAAGPLGDVRVRQALLAAIDRTTLIDSVLGGAATRADSAIPPSSWAFNAKASAPVAFNRSVAARGLQAAGWKRTTGGWLAPGAKKPYALELIAPDASGNPTALAVAYAVAADWRTLGLQVTVRSLPPVEFVVDRLRKGVFTAAAIEVIIGLDPDLYPLFASSQVVSGGSNLSGIQDVALDRLLTAARTPGTLAARTRAYAALQSRLTAQQYVLPIAFSDGLIVVSDRLSGPVIREVGDPSDRFWDVLTWRLADGR